MVRGACAGLGRPLDVVAEVAGVADTVDHRLVHRLRLHLELELHVQRAGGDEGVDARGRGALQGLGGAVDVAAGGAGEACNARSEEHTSELQSLMRNSYAVFCLKKKRQKMSS